MIITMAIWQANFSLINPDGMISLENEKSVNSIGKLCSCFPEKTSWSKNIRQFGEIDSTCIEFLYESIVESNDIYEIHVRLDLRSLTMEELKLICSFALENNLLVLVDSVFYEPTIPLLTDVIRNSDAHRFLSDPEGFLNSINEDL